MRSAECGIVRACYSAFRTPHSALLALLAFLLLLAAVVVLLHIFSSPSKQPSSEPIIVIVPAERPTIGCTPLFVLLLVIIIALMTTGR